MNAIRSRRSLLIPGLLLSLGLSACESPTESAQTGRLEPGLSFSTMPAQGGDTTLDYGTWNIEWFGDAGNGPSDEQLQLENVAHVIRDLDLDLWSLQEVVNHAHFDSLVARLDGYGGLLADDPFVTNGPEYYSDYSDTEQKVALLYKTSLVNVDSARVILTEYNYEFAGRPPVKVDLTVTLNGASRPLVAILLHAKAGSRGDAWERRKAGSDALKAYLDSNYPTTPVWVIGDFNDDVDVSIQRPNESPYKNFVDDNAAYTFPTGTLSAAGEQSTVNYSDMVDHHLTTNESYASYISGSAKVFYADQYIADYGQTTSDHYPVLTRYTWSGGGGSNAAPTAGFNHSCSELTCQFTDTSTDSDGTIAAWSWDVDGDGSADYTTQNASHTYAAAGTYSVTLTVTDDAGASDSHSATVTVGDGSGTPQILINEVEQNPAGGDNGNEWVELYNAGSSAVDVSGWTVNSNNGATVTVTLSGTIAAGGYLVVEYGGQWLDNSDESVTLRDGQGTELDRTPLFSDTDNNGNSWQRATDGGSTWQFKASTRGVTNN